MNLFDDPKLAVTPSAAPSTAVAPITSAQMPQFAPPPPAPPVPGLFGRLKARVANNLFRTPSGLGDLVTPDEVASARQQGLLSLGIALTQGHGENPVQSLGRGLAAAQQGFQGALQNTVGQKEQQIAMEAQVAQQRKLQLHAQLARQFAPVPNETTEQAITRLSRYASAMAQFDPDAAAKLGDTISKLRQPAGPALHTIDAKDRAITTDNKGNVIRTDTYGTSPAEMRAGDNQARADRRLDATEKRDATRLINTIVHEYNSSDTVKDFHKAERAHEVLNAARGNQGAFAGMAAIDAFARELNPAGAVRVGTLQILKTQGSAGQRIARAYEQFKSGRWSQSLFNDVIAQADAIMAEHARAFDDFRQQTVDGAVARGADPDVIEKALYGRRERTTTAAPKYGNTGKLGSY